MSHIHAPHGSRHPAKSLLSAGVAMLAAAAAGCAGEVDGSSRAVESEATSQRFYDCKGDPGLGDELLHIEVGMDARKLDLTDISGTAVDPGTGAFDPTYKPTPRFEGAIRFRGFDAITASFLDPTEMEVIVSKELQDKAPRGRIWIRMRTSEGGDTTQYACTSKPKKLAVDLARRSRLLCTTQQMVCTQDLPPGSSCMDNVFVNQVAADNASARLTITDHFGTPSITERKVTLEKSDALERTATGFRGSWGPVRLDLTYRGGVTYVGKFTSASGQTADAQCNDLAMLD